MASDLLVCASILLPQVLGTADQGVLIDAMAHLGTLFAMLLYFRADIGRAITGGVELVTAPVRKPNAPLGPNAKLALFILIATPPGLAAGVAYQMLDIGALMRSIYVIAAATIVFGALLWWSDAGGDGTRKDTDMTWKDALLVGLSQAVAFIPGTSRSGITMTAMRFLNFERTESARFAMLIGAPLLAAAGGYAFLELAMGEGGSATLGEGAIVAALSFVSAYASIALLMALVSRMSFLPFVLYRFALGLALLLASPLALGWLG